MAHDIRSLGRSLLVFANVLFGLCCAVVALVFYAQPSVFGDYDEATAAVSIAVGDNTPLELTVVVAGLLLALTVLYLMYGRRPKAPLHFVQSHAPGGLVKVAREALESGLRAAGEALDLVTRIRVTVEQGGLKRILVRAFFQAPDGVTIPDASRELRSALVARFGEMVRLGDGAKVDFEIEFVGFQGKLSRKPDSVAVEPQAFTGPRYPIGDEDPLAEGVRGN